MELVKLSEQNAGDGSLDEEFIASSEPKICLLGASFGTNNMGVNALTAGALRAFYEINPKGEMFLLDYGKDGVTYEYKIGDRAVPVQLENIRFSKKVYLKNNIAYLLLLAAFVRSIPFDKIRKKIISGNVWLSRVAEADMVASMAGGDSFSDIYGLGRFFYVALPQLLALFMRKKLVILPQTIGPFYGKIASAVAKYILKRADVIYSRDYDGVEVVRNMLGLTSGINGKVRFCYDVGFVLEPRESEHTKAYHREKQNPGKPTVGLNVSGLLYRGGYTGSNMFGLKVDYKEIVSDLIDFMIREKNATVLLVPHVFGTHLESDSVVCEELYASMIDHYDDRLFVVRGKYDQNEIKHIIGQCDFFIGSRMHACIAALSQNIPTVSIAYSGKFAGVMKTIGVEYLVADPRTLEKGEIIRTVENAFEKRVPLKEYLEKSMPAVKERVLNLFKEAGLGSG